jgi:AraC-like DNA-binding protein
MFPKLTRRTIPTASAGRLRTFVTRHAPRSQTKVHRHAAPYVAFVLEGGYQESSVDGIWQCEPGDLVVHPRMHLHVNRFSGRRSRVLNIVLPGFPWANLALSYGVWRPRDPNSIQPLREVDGEAIAEVLAHAEPSRELVSPPALSNMAERLTMDSRHRVGAAARHSGMTREHASRVFSRHFGFPPTAFRSEHRFRSALTLVIESTAALASIALEAGYADQAHLTRDFKSRTGMSPGAFRGSFRSD